MDIFSIAICIRMILSCVLVYFVFLETGIATTLAIVLIFISIEILTRKSSMEAVFFKNIFNKRL